jgi:hypothetical protein
MPTKKIEICCTKCQITYEVDYKVATSYMSKTRWMCDCGEMYHISDYVNGPTYSSHVSKEEDDKYTEYMKEHTRKEVINPTDNGREMYQIVEKWLNALSVEAIAGIEAQRTFHQTIDKDFVIETILEHCRTEDDLLEKLYTESLVSTIDFHASGTQCFTDKKDWYILQMIERVDPNFSRPFHSEQEVKDVIKALKTMPEYCQDSFVYFSVTKGAEMSLYSRG